jgi:phage terminase small subunit
VAKPKGEHENLTAKERMFVEQYVLLCHAQNACIAAGYPKASAHVTAYRLLKKLVPQLSSSQAWGVLFA